MTKKYLNTYCFSNLFELRDWLNRFEEIDLYAINFVDSKWQDVDSMVIDWLTEDLSDGSKVLSASIYLRNEEVAS